MGSVGGKYDIERSKVSQTKSSILPPVLYSSNRSKKEKASLPQFIHRNKLNYSLSSNANPLTILWLDTQIHNQPINIDTQIKLKNLCTYLRIYDEINQLEQYIEHLDFSNTEDLFLIISSTLALTIIPQIVSHPYIKFIYVYGKDKIDLNVKQQLLKKYPKVKGIYTKCQYLLAQINEDKQSTKK